MLTRTREIAPLLHWAATFLPSSLLCASRSLVDRANHFTRLKFRVADAVYLLVELFIVVNTVNTLFFQPPGDPNIAYWFHRQWVVLPGYLEHYKRPILLVHFFAGLVSLFGMRHQCGNQLRATAAARPGRSETGSPRSAAHRALGYVVLANQLLVHSPTILMMNAFVVDYRAARTAFYCMTFTATVKCVVQVAATARRGDMAAHRRAARTLYNYLSTFTKGRVYMYVVLPAVPDPWKAHHIFISDVVSVAVAARYSWSRMAKLSVVFAAYGLLLEALPQAWSALTALGVFYTVVYA